MPSSASPQALLTLLGIELPIVQAPMAGVSSPAMAAVTRHLGFGVTCNLVYEPPFLFALRSLATWLTTAS